MYDFKNSFLTLLTIALCDTDVSPAEVKILYDIGIQNGIPEKEVDDILVSPHKNKIEFPTDKNDKIDLLYNCAKMIWADGKVLDEERLVLQRVLINIGIINENIEKVTKYFSDKDIKNRSKQDIISFINNYL